MRSQTQSTWGPDTSASLLLRIRNPNDGESWRTFERIYGEIIRSYCQLWQLQPTDADDVTQDVLLHVSKSIRSFEYDPQKGRFRSWLGTVTANRIRKYKTKRGQLREIDVTAAESEIPPQSAATVADPAWIELFAGVVVKEACQFIRGEFTEKTWRCFELTWLNDISSADAAAQLGLTVHAVYVAKSRVLKRLEQQIRLLTDDVAFDFHGDEATL